MQITILNGNPDAENTAFDAYLKRLSETLTTAGHQATALTLRDMDIRYCTGCWGCWVKTPGQCVARDDSAEICRRVINADFVLFASPMIMGFPSALLKKTMDKLIPLVHPYLAMVGDEIHHLARYKSYPLAGLLLEPGDGTDQGDVQVTREIFSRTMLNLKSQLAFTKLTDEPVESTAQAIVDAEWDPDWMPPRRPTAQVGHLQRHDGSAPSHLTVFNGSPRGKSGNTQILLYQFLRGFENATGGNYEMYHLNRPQETARFREAFAKAECVLLGFPLYTDAMPGLVKAFIEVLESLCDREENPPVGFLVQSGFPEAAHSRYVERYLEKLSVRFGSAYIGTIVEGGAEAVRYVPPRRNRKLFDALNRLGAGFGETGALDAALLQSLAQPERLPKMMGTLFGLLAKTRVFDVWWNRQLKQNGAYEQRFAKPYKS